MFGDIIFLSIASFKIWVGILMQKVLHYNAIAAYIELITDFIWLISYFCSPQQTSEHHTFFWCFQGILRTISGMI